MVPSGMGAFFIKFTWSASKKNGYIWIVLCKAKAFNGSDGIQNIKGTLMQIWKSVNIFVFI